MKVLVKIKPQIEQKTMTFQSDIAGCHGISVSNAGTSDVTLKFLSGGGQLKLHPDEVIDFQGVADVPFDKDVLEGEFSEAEGVLEADRVDLVRIIKYIGIYEECR